MQDWGQRDRASARCELRLLLWSVAITTLLGRWHQVPSCWWWMGKDNLMVQGGVQVGSVPFKYGPPPLHPGDGTSAPEGMVPEARGCCSGCLMCLGHVSWDDSVMSVWILDTSWSTPSISSRNSRPRPIQLHPSQVHNLLSNDRFRPTAKQCCS